MLLSTVPAARIHALPEALANQIAAGEVVQRPASVVKELLENALDAGATVIELLLEQSGKALIQVLDDGEGMGPADARMCFERHATSKIQTVADLMRIQTLGFRGEALAAIAAVAQVVLRTRRAHDPLGTEVEVAGGSFVSQQSITCPKGTSIRVRNLFYTVPARRKFLKSNPVELRHILVEFYRVALAYPGVHFRLVHEAEVVYDLKPAALDARILALHSFLEADSLLPLTEETAMVNLSGYLGKPAAARKTRGEQYFMVNGRYVRDGYLHHAVSTALEGLLAPDTHPVYWLNLVLDPERVDVNIHPTKTEVKFEDERAVYQILKSAVRKAVGRLLNVPDFGDIRPGSLTEAIYSPRPVPQTLADFHLAAGGKPYPRISFSNDQPRETNIPHTPDAPLQQERLAGALALTTDDYPAWQVQERYILVDRPEGLLLIDQQAAHARVLYEQLRTVQQTGGVQQLLYPQRFSFDALEFSLVQEALPILHQQGFDLQVISQGEVLLSGVPYQMKLAELEGLMAAVLATLKNTGLSPESLHERLARAIAERGAIPPGKRLSTTEAAALVRQLMACATPAFAPGGRPTYTWISAEGLAERFGR